MTALYFPVMTRRSYAYELVFDFQLRKEFIENMYRTLFRVLRVRELGTVIGLNNLRRVPEIYDCPLYKIDR